jgi:hypothetical protein
VWNLTSPFLCNEVELSLVCFRISEVHEAIERLTDQAIDGVAVLAGLAMVADDAAKVL